MSLLSPPDPSDSNNPFKQQQDSVEYSHPGFFESAMLGLKEGTENSILGLNHIMHSNNMGTISELGITETPKEQDNQLLELQQHVNTYKSMISHEQGFNADAGNFLGQALNPMFLAAGAVTGGIADIALDTMPTLASSVLPKILSGEVGKKAVSLIPEAIKGGSFVGGGSLPSEAANNYNKNTKSINWGGTAKNVGENFGMGMALAPIMPVLGGILRKLKQSFIIKESANTISKHDINKADTILTPTEKQFLTAYNNKEDTDKLNILAKKWISENSNENLNSDGTLHVKLADPNQLSLLSDNGLQELANDNLEFNKTPVSDSIISSQLGETVNNTNIKDGLDGLIFHNAKAGENLQDVINKTIRDTRKSVNNLLDDKQNVSQIQLFNSALNKKYNGIVPDNIKEKISLTQNITKLKDELKNTIPNLSKDNNLRQNAKNFTINRINELKDKENSIKLLSYNEELKHIENSLIKKDILSENYEDSAHFERLLDMINPNKKSLKARELAAKIKVIGDYNKQQGFVAVAKILKEAGNNNNIRFNKSNDAIAYVRNNILNKQSISNEKLIKDNEKIAFNISKKDINNTLPMSDTFSTSESKQLLNDTNDIIKTLNEIKENKAIFNELNDCLQRNI